MTFYSVQRLPFDRVLACLPWPVSANNAKLPRGSRMVKTKESREYFEHVQAIVNESYNAAPLAGKLDATLEFYPPTNGRRDIFNFEKLPIDSLVAAGVFADDCDIDDGRVIRRPKVAGGAVVVTITQREV